jgi:hypothetical protein
MDELLEEEEPGFARGVCTPRALPGEQRLDAARTAIRINPVNAPPLVAGVITPARIAVMTSKYWGPAARSLTVSFQEPEAEAVGKALRDRIISHLNAWSQTANFRFVRTSGAGVGRVRITLDPGGRRWGGGYWSYLGTDILHIPVSEPTMCLQDFDMDTPESEYRRVIRHEAGHTLGFPHEHMRRGVIARIDPDKAYRYFGRTQGWSRQEVDEQVLTALEDSEIVGTPEDQTSIMCYQMPGSITRDGFPVIGGTDINALDFTFAGRIYPKRAGTAVPVPRSVGTRVAV